MASSRSLRAVDGDRQEDLSRYTRYVWNEVGLRDWTVCVAWGEWAPPPEWASVGIFENRRYAEVKVAQDFFEFEPDDQRHALVHEAVHCHLFEMAMAVKPLRAQVSPPLFEMFNETYHRHLEHTVDALTSALAPKLDPPPWVPTSS